MTTVDTMTQHLADETLAAFADGRLRGGERDEVISHLAECDDCRAIFDLVGDAQQEEVIETERHPVVVQGSFGRWAGGTLLAAAASVAIVVLTPAGDWINSKRTGGVSELAEFAEGLSQRRIESKIAGLPHKPYKEPTRGDNDPDDITDDDDIQLQLVEGKAHDVANRPATSARALRGKAVGHLLNREFQPALDAINAAIAKGGDEALLRADIAALYLHWWRWGAEDGRERALAAAEQSLAIRKTPEGAWNRALALHHLDRETEARAAWNDYLALDPSSPWADEVRSKYLNQNADTPKSTAD